MISITPWDTHLAVTQTHWSTKELRGNKSVYTCIFCLSHATHAASHSKKMCKHLAIGMAASQRRNAAGSRIENSLKLQQKGYWTKPVAHSSLAGCQLNNYLYLFSSFSLLLSVSLSLSVYACPTLSTFPCVQHLHFLQLLHAFFPCLARFSICDSPRKPHTECLWKSVWWLHILGCMETGTQQQPYP